MKKLLILSVLLLLALAMTAQSAKEEALQSLDSAKQLILQNNYPKAQGELNYASSKLSELLSEMLVLYLPDAPAGYKVEEKSASGLGQMGAMLGSANTVAAVGTYTATKENSDGDTPELTLTISLGGIMGQASGLAALGQMFGGMGTGTGSKTIRVSGYTGTQEYTGANNSATLTVQVGPKISVIVNGENLQSPDIMKTLAEKIELSKLEKAF